MPFNEGGGFALKRARQCRKMLGTGSRKGITAKRDDNHDLAAGVCHSAAKNALHIVFGNEILGRNDLPALVICGLGGIVHEKQTRRCPHGLLDNF